VPGLSSRIQLRRTKGWRKPADAISVARPTRWGNPWRIGPDGLVHGPGMFLSTDREASQRQAVALYRDWLTLSLKAPALMTGHRYPGLSRRRDWIREHLPELRGHDLCCWCGLDEPCHADVLLELVNSA
jgi:hypothetical protein